MAKFGLESPPPRMSVTRDDEKGMIACACSRSPRSGSTVSRKQHHENGSAASVCHCQPSAVEIREFKKKWSLLTTQERHYALQAKYDHLLQMAAELLPCVGCRNSTETLLHKLGETSTISSVVHESGVRISRDLTLTLSETHLNNPDAALSVFSKHERWGNSAAAKLGRGTKSNSRVRCFLHSQRARTGPRPATFESLWQRLSEDDRMQLSQIDADQFLTDLESYLRRRRFCCRCKEKVLEAYDLLIGTSCSEDDCEECAGFDYLDRHDEYGDELQYTSYLFDELSFCRGTGQILVPCHLEFMSQLMSRADEELVGDWGDRHARTIAEAQDEVLTCLGMVIWEKMQDMWTKNKSEKRAEELLVYVGIATIKKSFEIAVEALHGQEMMDQLLAEEDDESRRLARKKEKRKEKRKKRKNKSKLESKLSMDSSKGHGSRNASQVLQKSASNLSLNHHCECASTSSNSSTHSDDTKSPSSKNNNSTRGKQPNDGLSNPLSLDGPDNQRDDEDEDDDDDDDDGDDCDEGEDDGDDEGSASESSEPSRRKNLLDEEMEKKLLSSMGWIGLTDDHGNPEDEEFEESLIPEHEIRFWKRNQEKLSSKRQEQRQKLQERFNQFVRRNTQELN